MNFEDEAKVLPFLASELTLTFAVPFQGRVIKGSYKFHAIITTFEMILTDCPELRNIPWRCVVIDEAHRLKNRNCKLLEGLKMMDLVSLRISYICVFCGFVTPGLWLHQKVKESIFFSSKSIKR